MLVELQHGRTCQRGEGEEEAEFGRSLAIHSHRHCPEYRRAGARYTGDHGETLHHAHHGGALPANFRHAAHFLRLGIFLHHQYRKAADDQRPCHDHRIFQHQFDSITKGEAEDDGGKEGEQQVACKGHCLCVPFEQSGEHFPEGPPIEHDNGKYRARLDRDVEQGPALGVITHQLSRENQMPGGGYGEEFGDAFDNAEDHGGPEFTHRFSALSSQSKKHHSPEPAVTGSGLRFCLH